MVGSYENNKMVNGHRWLSKKVRFKIFCWGFPFGWWCFHRNANQVKNSFHCNPILLYHIATSFAHATTAHVSYRMQAVYSDHLLYFGRMKKCTDDDNNNYDNDNNNNNNDNDNDNYDDNYDDDSDNDNNSIFI